MGFFSWILLGLIAGFIGSKIVNKSGQGMLLDIALGIFGAIVGGLVFSLFGATGITGFNIYSLIVAVIGSVAVLWIYHTITGRRSIG
ncbi:GlsB/YeaQ/YmgE family stress response membrane protein [Phyllobacterium phragmitis]|uniref:GlsB/YeaQ/YmgE family stress response membrane protein n=1 Tax=Phyllobacterium phragmitis TaxID=2670329 RepID=A0A2S9IYU7_9HYPH|nr:GlsB/YeaQ/YmgE family stress response membrane protein [Phyllobacterium phragmitis]PRD45702.1 GlsB/YeaQ/YmgE family stress response membrane protein [Phyllobacterium phragmitis]